MDRLATQLERLYGTASRDPTQPVRAIVLELAGPGAWARLSAVWQGVQEALEWPAPAIAVSGTDAFQLWFSLAEPVAPVAAQAFLDGLHTRHLADLPVARLRQHLGTAHLQVPSQQPDGNWSAFIAPDLAPVFADTPWLDIPPGADGQADLLAALRTITPQAWATALAALNARPSSSAETPAPSAAPGVASGPFTDPRSFLLHVMNDPSAALALRIEAAKALLQQQGSRNPSP